jgi:hypothetical protein
VDLIPGNIAYNWYGPVDRGSSRLQIRPWDQNQEAIAIDALTLRQYHSICYWNLSQSRTFDCPTSATVNLNTIVVCTAGDQLEDLVEIAFLPDAEAYLSDWGTAAGATGEIMEGGWTRY